MSPTIPTTPDIAVMALLPDRAPIGEEIRGASKHIAASWTKDAECQAETRKGSISKIGEKKVAFGIFDGAGDIQGAGRRLEAIFPTSAPSRTTKHISRLPCLVRRAPQKL